MPGMRSLNGLATDPPGHKPAASTFDGFAWFCGPFTFANFGVELWREKEHP